MSAGEERFTFDSDKLEKTMEFTLIFLRVFFQDLVYAGPILIFLVLLIIVIGCVIGRIEGWSSADAFYHAFINATTVGYGDLRPTKKSSKLLAVANALVGLVFTGIVVAIALHAGDQAFGIVYDSGGFRDRTQ